MSLSPSWKYATIIYLGVAMIGIGLVAWTGHLTGRQFLYTWLRLHADGGAMSRPTATMCVMAGISFYLIGKDHYQTAQAKGKRVRKTGTAAPGRARTDRHARGAGSARS